MRGIEGFSHLWLVFGFHATAAEGWRPTVRPPRLGGDERIGVFASRSTYRPNGLGLSVVKLEGVDFERPDGPVLLLGGVDLIDGTPVYDIKPYLAYSDALPDAVSGYAPDAPARMRVEISEAAAGDFEKLPERSRQVIREVLSLDPRPPTAADPHRVFGAELCGRNVRFQVAESICVVVAVDEIG